MVKSKQMKSNPVISVCSSSNLCRQLNEIILHRLTTHTHMYVNVHTWICTHAYTHKQTHTIYTHKQTHTIYMHKHTRTQIQTHTHTQTNTHTYLIITKKSIPAVHERQTLTAELIMQKTWNSLIIKLCHSVLILSKHSKVTLGGLFIQWQI